MPKKILAALSIALLAAGAFVFGFASSLHLKRSASSDVRRQVLLQRGDAPDPARAEVLDALRAFQAGYIKRDPKELDVFMSRLFPENGDPLLLGTDKGEWVHGYRAVGEFIREDWLKWGDFRFDVENSIVSSAGDVAWIASVGSVRGLHSERPLRFSAVLTRDGHQWRFRQVQFQWDERDPRLADLLRPDTYRTLAKWVLQHIAPTS
jgi:hypothetical protein